MAEKLTCGCGGVIRMAMLSPPSANSNEWLFRCEECPLRFSYIGQSEAEALSAFKQATHYNTHAKLVEALRKTREYVIRQIRLIEASGFEPIGSKKDLDFIDEVLQPASGEREMKTKYKYIHFEKVGMVVVLWQVKNNKTDTFLGTIDYYPPWNCYVFQANGDCVFNVTCLADIIDFMKQLEKLH